MSNRIAKGEYVETVCRTSNLITYFFILFFFFCCVATNQESSHIQDTGNKVSRRSQISGTTNIILGGKTVIQSEVIIRGDLLRTFPSTSGEMLANQVAVSTGRYCFFARGCELRPPGKIYKGQVCYYVFGWPNIFWKA